MSEAPPRVPLGRHGRMALVGWLGAIGLIVGLALAGPAAEPRQTASPDGGGSSIELTGPAPGTRYLGDGIVVAGARITPSDRPIVFEVVAAGAVIGSVEANLDGQGLALATIPVLPPPDGGPATIVARDRSDPGVTARVDISFEPANPVIVWLPLPDREPAVTEPGLRIRGHARPPVAAIALDARDSENARRAAARGPLGVYAALGDPPPWTAFEVRLPPIALPDDRCIWLEVTGLASDGSTISVLDIPSATCR